ncbi:ATG16 autophagy related 16-like 2 isoform X2 [Denticeps clupeoides]|uniref:ATG16 autophagy related 16-like 2 isoform X2 n=1 Tax=Denticeps clupeoides TaxID=299321 RepID=UPI0010A43C06|nr:autophagy-related protein 16-2-like isoform X2 [Denticeps clupeoides]
MSAPACPESASKDGEAWRRHIIRQLKLRDRFQKIRFQDVIRAYFRLQERTNQRATILQSVRPTLTSCSENVQDLKTTTGELAYHAVELQQKIKIREAQLEDQHARLCELHACWVEVDSARSQLRCRVEEVRTANLLRKCDYDELLRRHRDVELRFRLASERSLSLEENLMKPKQKAAERMNHLNERRSRSMEATSNVTTKLTTNTSVGPGGISPEKASLQKTNLAEKGLARFLSLCFPDKTSADGCSRRKCGQDEDLFTPVGVCVAARVPAVVKHKLDAHDLGINAVRFSSSSNLLATGSTDRFIKLWDVRAGQLDYRGTLGGSNEGITSIEFDPSGTRILAASYDKSALLWRLEDPVPKLTLTGHTRKVTAARFKCSLWQVVTGSADRTVKLWDLHRAACTQTMEVTSHCSDVVCSEYVIVSGHYDHKIRFWDSRLARCTRETLAQGRVTSLDICPDHRQLLSCSRDDSLQVVDLRMVHTPIFVFSAEGFKCGSDSTKAIFSPDGSYVAAGSADWAVYVWNVGGGHLEARLPEVHSSTVSAVAWSSSGEYVVSVDKSRCAVLWSDI